MSKMSAVLHPLMAWYGMGTVYGVDEWKSHYGVAAVPQTPPTHKMTTPPMPMCMLVYRC